MSACLSVGGHLLRDTDSPQVQAGNSRSGHPVLCRPIDVVVDAARHQQRNQTSHFGGLLLSGKEGLNHFLERTTQQPNVLPREGDEGTSSGLKKKKSNKASVKIKKYIHTHTVFYRGILLLLLCKQYQTKRKGGNSDNVRN